MWTSADDSMKAAFERSEYDANNDALYGMNKWTKCLLTDVAQIIIPAYIESARDSIFPRTNNFPDITPVYVVQVGDVNIHYEGGNCDYNFNYGYSARKDVDKNTPIECTAKYFIRNVELYKDDNNRVHCENRSKIEQELVDYLNEISFEYKSEKFKCNIRLVTHGFEDYIEAKIKCE